MNRLDIFVIGCLHPIWRDVSQRMLGRSGYKYSWTNYTWGNSSEDLWLGLSPTLTEKLSDTLSLFSQKLSFCFISLYTIEKSQIWLERRRVSTGTFSGRPLTIFPYFLGPFLMIEHEGTHMKSRRHSSLIKPITVHSSPSKPNHNLGVCIWWL